ncbi:MAG: hypothetical protein JRI68_15105 [Deltaproteobacteria bacterium]|nr:hypothetical protein [Deltaproteobacteria bacterium]
MRAHIYPTCHRSRHPFSEVAFSEVAFSEVAFSEVASAVPPNELASSPWHG